MIDDYIPTGTLMPEADPWDHNYVWVCAGRRGGEACVGGTRLPALQMADCWWQGHRSAADICEDYDITIGQLLEACYFASQYGGRAWRQRWKAWAESPAFTRLWHAKYSEDLLPPQKQTASRPGGRE